ncbi:MAG: hypothetical protein K0S65_3052, partial [Labilithrix sp.]|nr:hypothetical protein [Labilithrix sp.]
KDGKRRLALWAATQGNAENASANAELATTTGFDVQVWDGAQSTADAAVGKATIALTGSPVFLVER